MKLTKTQCYLPASNFRLILLEGTLLASWLASPLSAVGQVVAAAASPLWLQLGMLVPPLLLRLLEVLLVEALVAVEAAVATASPLHWTLFWLLRLARQTLQILAVVQVAAATEPRQPVGWSAAQRVLEVPMEEQKAMVLAGEGTPKLGMNLATRADVLRAVVWWNEWQVQLGTADLEAVAQLEVARTLILMTLASLVQVGAATACWMWWSEHLLEEVGQG